MAFFMTSVLALVTCYLCVVAHAHRTNSVLSTSSDYMYSEGGYMGSSSIVVEPSDVYVDVSMTSFDPTSSSSSVAEPTDSEDPPYVPSDSAGESSAPSSSSSAGVGEPPHDSSHATDELSSDLSSSSVSSSLSSESDSSKTEESSLVVDPPYAPPESSSSYSSVYLPRSLEQKTVRSGSVAAGNPKRGPAASPADASPDSDRKGKPGRPPAVFNTPRSTEQDDATRREGHGKRIGPMGGEDGTGEAGRKPGRGGRPAQGNGKGPLSERPGRQWGGPPSTQRRKELRDIDTNYLDMYLCGQFTTETADDFAVASFNYAGRTQPFSPCSVLGSTSDTINYVYRTASGGRSALRRVVDALPAAWDRHVAEKGAAPRIVHVFAVNLPAELSGLIRLRRSAAMATSRFVLGYLNQPAASAETDSAREFLATLGRLTHGRIEPVRVCGRCAKVTGYPAGGRRRRDMLFGMSVVSRARMGLQCLPVEERSIPGADLAATTCDSFQKSVVRCAQRSIQRRCLAATAGGGTDPARIDSAVDADLIDSAVGALTRACAVDSECWRREGESIRVRVEPKSQNRCKLSGVAMSKMLGRCALGAASLPFSLSTEFVDLLSQPE